MAQVSPTRDEFDPPNMMDLIHRVLIVTHMDVQTALRFLDDQRVLLGAR